MEMRHSGALGLLALASVASGCKNEDTPEALCEHVAGLVVDAKLTEEVSKKNRLDCLQNLAADRDRLGERFPELARCIKESKVASDALACEKRFAASASAATQSAGRRQLPPIKQLSAAAPATATPAEPVQAKGPFPESTDPNLKDVAKASVKAPAKFTAKFETTVGDFEVECTRDWAPIAVDRFYSLVKVGFFDDIAFFRVMREPKPFMVQFGIHGNPEVSKVWREANLDREDVKQSNTRGMLTFAMSGQTDTPKKTTATRSTQLFINYADNSNLDAMGFAPLCQVTGDGMNVVDKIYTGYGAALGEKQGKLQMEGNKFLREKYPAVDYIKTVRLAGDDKDKKDKKDEKGASSASPKASAAPKSTAAPKATAAPAP